MRTQWIGSCALTLVAAWAFAQPQAARPRPPGLGQAESIEKRLEVEPPAPPHRPAVAPAQLKREADELARLAGTISLQIDQVTKGALPKDLLENLKRTEKLARHLRAEVSP